MADQQPLLDVLSTADKALFLRFGFGAVSHPPFICVHQAFEFHAAHHPDSVAVQDGPCSIKFSELDHQSSCLAAFLRDIGIGPGSRICLLVERSIAMIIGILGILKAGAAYVPCDGKVVSDKSLEHILTDSECRIVVTLGKFAHRVTNLPVVSLDKFTCPCSSNGARCAKPEDLSAALDVVYVIYTSGTTGVPKGVEVEHRNVVNLLTVQPGNLGMQPGRRVSQLMNIAFDMAAWEILGSLCNGATLVLRGQTSKEWRSAMRSVDIIIATPSMLAPHDPVDYPDVKVVAVAGEACPRAVADSWAKHTQFYNCCGPTEVTIVNTMHLHLSGQTLSIGRPTPNNNVYILNEDMMPTPIGVPGIMWAGGDCVTRGYLNLPDKTSERYKADPFVHDGSLMFNTGDLGCWRADGTLEHLGRIDDQVKIKGFRVELDGVAAAMETAAGVHAAIALLINEELWGFVTPASADIDEVKIATAKIQPYYAVPRYIRALHSFPRTGNDKTDKRALRQLALDSQEMDITSSIPDKSLQPLVTSRISNGATRQTDIDSKANDLASEEQLEDLAISKIMPPPTSSSSTSSLTIENSMTGEKLSVLSTPVLSEDSASSVELKEREVWDGYEKDVLPEKMEPKLLRNLRHQIFTLYRRLFGLVFVANMIIFIILLARGGANTQHLGLITISNLFCAILMRNDYVVNVFFNVLCAVPTSWPLSIRRICARVYHIGGLHSGCAVSGVVWLILLCGQATREVTQGGEFKASIATVAISYSILLLLLGIVVFAHPAMRTKRHDSFERAHRFMGWTGIILVWFQVAILTNDYKPSTQSLSAALIHSPPFWLLVVMTGSIILPWLRLRKVAVRSEVLSKHAVRLHFSYSTPIPGSFVRLAEHPLKDWHGFATIPVPNEKGFSLVVSRAGDWTATRIAQPPSAIWVRGAPCFGVLRIVPLFRRVVFVATGSGIGPCAPCILEQRVPIRLLWTSPNVRETFGDKLVDEILTANPDAVVYDTRKHGKPDMVKLTLRLVSEFDAEAVCVISNQKLTQKIVYGCMSRGIPAFGAIWDS